MNSAGSNQSLFENDHLISALIELANLLEKHSIPLIIGGGLSLYLRSFLLQKIRSPRYPKRVVQRSTKDIDIFLTSDLIIDSEKIEILRDSLAFLGYKPKTKYFQFTKDITLGNSTREVTIDILSSPPKDEDAFKTKISKPRIKPANVDNFHAYLVIEAKAINFGPIPVESVSILSGETKISNIFIPSGFNYIILKLHAFRDRIEDESVDLGRHHAYDIFAVVTDMDKNDWENAAAHFEAEKESDSIKSSIDIINEFFSTPTSLGIIRLQENQFFKKYSSEFSTYIPEFISDLKSLFGIF
ncbi:MAG: hypothetical protein M0P71_18635 [Melioribacteraceae bacterium]|nr:hypothetical protein [Melioribacteraceae bacterium]